MKNKIYIGVVGLISFICLFGCRTSSQTTSKNKVQVTESTTNATFTAKTGAFSVQAPKQFQNSHSVEADNLVTDTIDAVSLEHTSQKIFLHAVRYDKASIAVPIHEFASKLLAQSVRVDALKQLIFNPMTLAGKTGYGVTTTTTDTSSEYAFTSFIFEDGSYYKIVVAQSPTDLNNQLHPLLTSLITSWKDTTTAKSYQLTQTITLPNTELTLTIPSDWNMETRTDANSDIIDYLSKDKTKYLSVYAKTTDEGYTFDLPGFVAETATNISTAATTREITIGSYAGYLVEATEISQEIWSSTVNTYIFQLDNRTIRLHFSIPTGEIDSFRPTMEAIVASLK